MATYTLTVTFLDLETRKDAPSLLTVKLPQGETMTLEAEPYCRFIDDRQQDLSPSDFGKRHKGKKVTIDFMEREPEIFVILECRSGTA
ncbi:MAG: hypothetical protein LBP21_04680 [Synergistaceae bacterium]|nr:hypothetical protein [Synergistaceae bacterium]